VLLAPGDGLAVRTRRGSSFDSVGIVRNLCSVIEPNTVEALLRAAFPDAQIELTDLTGSKDHYQAVLVSSAFAGKTPIEQHQLVYRALAEEMKGPIHALALKTYSPEAWAKRAGT
jgi:stress-induced morphogen